MSDSREVPTYSPPHSTQWGSDDLKAQEDLLSLKVLQDPGFLKRVPTLHPSETVTGRALSPEAHFIDAQSLHAQAYGGERALINGVGQIEPSMQGSLGHETPEDQSTQRNPRLDNPIQPLSTTSTPSFQTQQEAWVPEGAIDPHSLPEPHDWPELTPEQIEDTHLKMITQEVTQRVFEQLEELVPELIASTLEEVLRGVPFRAQAETPPDSSDSIS